MVNWFDLIKANFPLVIIAGLIALLISWLGIVMMIAFIKQYLPIVLFAGIIIIFYFASGNHKRHK